MPVPINPNNCVIYGYLVDVRNKPEREALVQAFREDSSILSGGKGVSSKVIATYTKKDGYFSLELARGQLISIEIPAVGIRKKFIVPDQNDIDFFTITTESPP